MHIYIYIICVCTYLAFLFVTSIISPLFHRSRHRSTLGPYLSTRKRSRCYGANGRTRRMHPLDVVTVRSQPWRNDPGCTQIGTPSLMPPLNGRPFVYIASTGRHAYLRERFFFLRRWNIDADESPNLNSLVPIFVLLIPTCQSRNCSHCDRIRMWSYRTPSRQTIIIYNLVQNKSNYICHCEGSFFLGILPVYPSVVSEWMAL